MSPARRRRPLRRVLVPNRGEIAVRIVRACRDLGIESVVAHSEPDRGSLACRLADDTICIGGPRPAESYLNVDAILAAAVGRRADAVHPGYGFLAENAGFARRCADEGITFIGPPPAAIETMGNKLEARQLARRIGVPVTAGGEAASADEAVRMVDTVGLPIIVKAAAGGGGRGMRLARSADEVATVASTASAEAAAAFGDGTIYVERYVERARHIEIQVAFDGHGNGIHLGERDCTIQRRYQKLVEEAPSPSVDGPLRARMADAALALCREVDYESVGTVEFLLDQASGEFFFIEMNTRLQVEHPVTELVTGIDLVELQLAIAAGEELGIAQDDVRLSGHAIEFRINAEDPAAEFRPAAGAIDALRWPLGPGTRVDTHAEPGYTVPPYYDSLVGKLVAYGDSRRQALARATRALGEIDVTGIATTVPFHRWLVTHPDFASGATSTGWAEATWPGRAET